MFLHFPLNFSMSNEVSVITIGKGLAFLLDRMKLFGTPCETPCCLHRTLLAGKYVENISCTRWWEDMNFMFEWQEWYLTSEHSEQVRYCSRHENFNSWLDQCFYYIDRLMAGFVIIFQRFSTTLRRFPKIFPNSSEGHANVAEHFLKMSEDYSEEDPKMFRSYTNEL